MCTLRLPSKTAPTSADAKRKSPPRPYTAYNIFFQLEREYVLQHDLNVTPDLRPEDVFDPSSASYDGPDLPRKYQGLVLRSDWHRSGKARRNKRQHRASHGAIGFCELSKLISASWRTADNDVKLFCAQLSDIGQMAYKKKMHKLKTSAKSVAAQSKLASCCKSETVLPAMSANTAAVVLPDQVPCIGMPLPSVSPEIDASEVHLPPLDFTLLPAGFSSFLAGIGSEPVAPPVNEAPRRVSVDAADQELTGAAPPCRMVDILDAEIFSMWMRC